MQAVQLDQLLPQIQTAQNTPQDLKTGDTSFMDELRAQQEELKREDEPAEKDDKSTEKTDHKTASVKSSENEKPEAAEKTVTVIENAAAQTQVKTASVKENEPIVVRYTFAEKGVPQTDDDKPAPLTEKQLKWLTQPVNKAASEEKFSDEDFAKLIDAAVEFIPGEDSEDELLEKAQNLSAKDPSMFLANLNADPVPDNNKSLSDLKNDSKDKISAVKAEKKPLISVTDLRTAKIDENSNELAVTKVQSKKDLNLSYKRTSQDTVQVTMDLSAAAKENITSSSSQAAGATSSTFQSMLANAVQNNAPDFVKAGNVVLKDNNQGNINLVLHPEKLGNVKINLNLNDKVISGSITVHSQEAYEAMKDSIAALKNAFASSGFETGEFNLNFNNGSQEFAQSQQGQHQQNQQAAFRADLSYGDYVSVGSESEAEFTQKYASAGDYSVNIVA